MPNPDTQAVADVGSSGLAARVAALEAAAGNTAPNPAWGNHGGPNGNAGVSYSYIYSTVGTPTPALSISGGSIAGSGLTFVDNHDGTATLSGVNPVAGTYNFTVQATSTAGTITQAQTVVIASTSTITDPLARWGIARPAAFGGGSWAGHDVWRDEFDGLAAPGANLFSSGPGAPGANAQGLNTTRFQPNWLGGNDTDITTPVQAGTNSCAYAPSQCVVQNGVLTITAQSVQTTTNGGSSYPNRSGLINTKAKTNGTFTFGFFEARLFVSIANGSISNWPAWWLNELNNNFEPDMFEGLSGHAAINLHNIGGAGSPSVNPNTPASSQWINMGILWISGVSMQVWYDYGAGPVSEIGPTSSGPTGTAYLIMNLATGPNGNSGGPTVLPSTFQCEYMRVWQ